MEFSRSRVKGNLLFIGVVMRITELINNRKAFWREEIDNYKILAFWREYVFWKD